jgi:rod shape-determining protein MreC
MNKKFFYIIIAIFIILAFYLKNEIEELVLYEFNSIKQKIINVYDSADFKITTYFNQAKQIQKLTKENKKYRDYIESVLPILQSYKQLKQFKNINNPNVVFTQTISYAKLPDMSAIYVSYSDNNNKDIKGLIFNNTSAGIITKTYKNYSLALLNNNPKTSYTVFIGKNKIPGIVFGGEKMIIKYIPKYEHIKIGDLVITSGLDKIFYEGVKVGKITSIIQKKLYQEAIIKPFYNSYNPAFFYVVNFKF